MSNAAKGALWMIAAAAALTAMAACIRYLPGYSVLLMIFLRNVINLGLMAPSLARQGSAVFRTEKLGLHALRNAFLYSGNVAWFFGVTQIAIADVAALQFTSPLFTAIIAAIWLGERFGGHRALAIVVGFAGALIILRPGLIPVNAGSLSVLLAAFFYSCAHVVTKRLSDTESGSTVVFYMSVTILIYSAIPAFFVWQTPKLADLPWILGLGVTGYVTHYCITRSLACADATFVIPFDFMRLPFSAIVGWVLFAELLDAWTATGALIIFAAGWYSTMREARAESAARRGDRGRGDDTSGQTR
jgi:drug/metabolite transporter (DMT)-like permease